MRRPALLLLLALPLGAVRPDAQENPRAARIADAAALNTRRAPSDALKILEPLLLDSAVQKDDALMAGALRQSGAAWFQLNEYAKALDAYERGLPLSRRAADRGTEAGITYGIAQVFKNRGSYPSALERATAALALYDAAGDVQAQARTYVLLGSIQDLMGRHRAALQSYQTALPMFDHANRRTALQVLNEIGITLKNLGLYQDALDHYARALEGQVQMGDRYGQAVTLLNTGVAYNLLGQDDRALDAYRRCLAIVHEIGERRGESIVLGNLGDLLADRGDDARALTYYEQQLALTRVLGNRNEEAEALKAIGDVRTRSGDFEHARQSYDAALTIQRRSGARRREGLTLSSMADAALRQGRAEEAAALAEQAAAIARDTDSPDLEWRARFTAARAARTRGAMDAALADFEDAARIVNDLRTNIGSDASKIGFLEGRQQVFQELASTLLEAGRPADALEAAEAGRARAFADLLEQRSIAGKPPDRSGLTDVRAAIDDVRAARVAPHAPSADDNGAVSRRSAVLDERLAHLGAEHHELASLLTAGSPTRAEIASTAARLNATVIEYLVTDRQVLAWTVSPKGEIHAATLAVDGRQLDRLTTRVRGAIHSVTAAGAATPPQLTAALRELDRRLIAPLRAWLPTAPDAVVVVVPQGRLAVLPFAAFEDARGVPLVRRHTLAFAPAISVYRYTPAKRQPRDASAASALVVADPTPPPGSGLTPLPGARQEGRLVSERLGRGATLLSGAAASESAVKRLAGDRRILHFATHGLVSAERPLASSLMLAAGDGEDGYLRVDEIFGLSLHADLVVLSGCSTGLGRLSGDGIVGLSRAFIYAGTPAVLVSQWDVNDRVTAFLMDRFYAARARGGGTAAALRAAQLATRARYPDPWAWAGFVLTGEPR